MTAVHTTNYLEENGLAWSENKAKAYREVFEEFLQNWYIASKEGGNMILGGNLNGAQTTVVDRIFDGLQQGIHDFKMLKGRQQGISTICRPFVVMWTAMHPGARCAIVLDTAKHMADCRREIEYAIEQIPSKLRFPKFRSNRYGGLFEGTKSSIDFLAAGVRETAGSGGLGRGAGCNVCTGSEMCMWGAQEGLTSFRKSLAKTWENRLYLWESTGRNIGSIWYDMWQRAKANDLEEATIFTGWYLIHGNRIPHGTAMFERYGEPAISREESRRIAEVKDRYGYEISREQLAWIRKETNPAAYGGGDEQEDGYADDFGAEDDYGTREDPWTEDEAFSMDGSNFFEAEVLTKVAKATVKEAPKAYSYYCSDEFVSMIVQEARTKRDVHLKVWEEPRPEGVYVVAADPAYGANEHNDRSAAQVLRCYADKVEQVAEFASAKFKPHQFAWVLGSLMGWYRNTRLILEINGPGAAVWQEYSTLKRTIDTYQRPMAREKGLANFFDNCKNYVYSRVDAILPGSGSVHQKTTPANKVALMERERDFLTRGALIIRSRDVLEEMKAVTRDGDVIRSEGRDHDDRVLSLAMGVLCWEQMERRRLQGAGRTYEAEQARAVLTPEEQYSLLTRNQLTQYFKSREMSRMIAQSQARRDAWRWW